MTCVALIPARAGSKRIPRKNTKLLAGHPLIAYTMAAAQQSGVFHRIVVATDDLDMVFHLTGAATDSLARRYGAEVFHRLPAPDDQPDIAWILAWSTSETTVRERALPDAFAILRPTSPFRTAATIQRAWRQFNESDADSLRAVEPWHGPHPGKMWIHDRACGRMYPVMKDWTAQAPYHSSPTQSLVPVVKQNASLEIAWTRVLWAIPPTITGDDIRPFFTDGHEGYDLNTPEDWDQAEQLIRDGKARLPHVPHV